MHSLTGLGRRSPAPPHQASNFQLSIPLTVKCGPGGWKGNGVKRPTVFGPCLSSSEKGHEGNVELSSDPWARGGKQNPAGAAPK